MLTEVATLDAVLDTHAAELGGDFTGYRNHAYRVANLCVALSGSDAQQLEKIAVAAAFHDLGIWTAGTFDYLRPSIDLARAYLVQSGKADWTEEISGMILQHHKSTPYRGNAQWLVEPFRKADWIDVTGGLRSFGLPRRFIREIYGQWPSAGFHKRLVQLEFGHLGTHPLNPLPMVRL
jgi:hypothetical protein